MRKLEYKQQSSVVDDYIGNFKKAYVQLGYKLRSFLGKVWNSPQVSVNWSLKHLNKLAQFIVQIIWIILRAIIILSALTSIFSFWLLVYYLVQLIVIPNDIQEFPIHFDYHYMYRTYSEIYSTAHSIRAIHTLAPHTDPPYPDIYFQDRNTPFSLDSDTFRTVSQPTQAYYGKESAQATIPFYDELWKTVNYHQQASNGVRKNASNTLVGALGFSVDIALRAFVPDSVPLGMTDIYESNPPRSKPNTWPAPVMLTIELFGREDKLLATSVRPLLPPPEQSPLMNTLYQMFTFLPALFLPNPPEWMVERGRHVDLVFFDRFPVVDESHVPKAAVVRMSPAAILRNPKLVLVTRLSGITKLMKNYPLVCATVFSSVMSFLTLLVLIPACFMAYQHYREHRKTAGYRRSTSAKKSVNGKKRSKVKHTVDTEDLSTQVASEIKSEAALATNSLGNSSLGSSVSAETHRSSSSLYSNSDGSYAAYSRSQARRRRRRMKADAERRARLQDVLDRAAAMADDDAWGGHVKEEEMSGVGSENERAAGAGGSDNIFSRGFEAGRKVAGSLRHRGER